MAALKKYHKAACTCLPEDEHLDVQKLVEDTIIELKHNVKSMYFVCSYYLVVS